MRTAALSLIAGFALACVSPPPGGMSRERMESLIAELGSDVQGDPGFIQFDYDGVRMACVSDIEHDRMRLIAPIVARGEVAPRQLELMLLANYHSSLDARYAISRGVVYSAFLHPLSALSEELLAAALRQVATLAKTFGSTYSSGELMFGAPRDEAL